MRLQNSTCAPPPVPVASPLPPPSLAAPQTVTVGLSLAGINLSTFSLASLVIGLAGTVGADSSALNVTITDLPVSTTLTLAGSGLTSISTSALAALKTSLVTVTGVSESGITLGAVAVAGRRHLLDVSVPVTVSGLGGSIAAASAVVTALTSTSNLNSIAASVPGSTSATPSTPSVSARVSVVVTTSNPALIASANTALANPATVTAGLSSAGVTATVTVTTPPSVNAPPPPQAAASPAAARLRGSRWLAAAATLVCFIMSA